MEPMEKTELKKLLLRFYNENQTERFIDDMSYINNYFDTTPAPVPAQEFKFQLKLKVRSEVSNRNFKSSKIKFHFLVPVAATILFLAYAGVRFLDYNQLKQNSSPKTASSLYFNSDSFFDNIDQDLAQIENEINTLESDIKRAPAGYVEKNSSNSQANEHTEFVLLNDFWEG